MKNEKLKGFSSIDFIINNGKIYFLEINARLSASYKLYKERYGKSLIRNHFDSYKYKLNIKNYNYFAEIVLYAKSELIISERINEISNISDIPNIGERIDRNQPILSIKLSSKSRSNLYEKIKMRINNAKQIIDCYNIELEYE